MSGHERKPGDDDIPSGTSRIEIGLPAAQRWPMIAKRCWQVVAKLSTELLQRAASQTTTALSHCYTSLESFLKAKLQVIRPPVKPTIATQIYEIRPRADKRGVDLISDALPLGPLWYPGPNAVRNAIGYARFHIGSRKAVIRIYDEAGNVIQTHEQSDDSQEL